MRRSQIFCGLAFCAAINQVSRVHGIALPNPISLIPIQQQDDRPPRQNFQVESVDYRKEEPKCRKPETRIEKILVEQGTCLR